MRISDWSSDVCSSDLLHGERHGEAAGTVVVGQQDETRHRIWRSNTWDALIAERSPDRNAEEDHRRDRCLDALGNSECISGGRESHRTCAGVTEQSARMLEVARASALALQEIGRASCREGGGQYG